MLSYSSVNRDSLRILIASSNSPIPMHSPAPMSNGGYGMPMNNYGPQQQPGMRGPPNMPLMMQNPDEIISAGFNGNFNNGAPPPPPQPGMTQHMSSGQMPGQQNPYNMMPNGLGQPGAMMNLNTHGNMMSPLPTSAPCPGSGQNPMMMSSSHPQNMMSSHPQQNPNQIMGMYNANSQQQSPILSQTGHTILMSHSPHNPSPHPTPGMSPHPPPQPMIGQYPQQGISPHPGQQVPNNGQTPSHNILQNVHNQMLPNNPHGRVMSPLQQPNGGMISPHPHQMTQGGPGQGGPPPLPHLQPGMMPPHMQQGNGQYSPGMPRGNMMPPQQINPGMIQQGMMPPHPQHPHAGMISPHNQSNSNMMINHHQPHSGQSNIIGSMVSLAQIQTPIAKTYPPGNTNMHNNQANANSLFMLPPCGVCHREIQIDREDCMMCESGCNLWFHRICINMSPDAYHLIKSEMFAEWVCDNCIQTKRIALIKFKS